LTPNLVRLPSGALVTKVEYYYYDAYPSDNVRMQFWRANSQTSNSALFNHKPPITWSPGYLTGTWIPGGGGLRIANGQGWYYVRFDLASAAGSSHRLWGVRLYWNRQIDVPTNYWAFKAIEALADSGITTGCGGGNFCPDQSVTRAQMAVFLAKALGLHWDYPY